MRVSVKIPESYLEIIDRLVDLGRYTCRSEFIRTAVRKLIDEELAKEHLNSGWRGRRRGVKRAVEVKVID
jgi:Arc/MetJ-type ribon-helix-helix transcriptional regulator